MFDVYVALAFGIIGFVFISFDYSRIVLLIAVVLGTLAERSFLQTYQLANIRPEGYLIFVNRPQSAILVVFIVLTLLSPLFRRFLVGDSVLPLEEIEP